MDIVLRHFFLHQEQAEIHLLTKHPFRFVPLVPTASGLMTATVCCMGKKNSNSRFA